MRVQVNQRDGVLRELRRRILLAFEKENIAFGTASSTLRAGASRPDACSTDTAASSTEPSAR